MADLRKWNFNYRVATTNRNSVSARSFFVIAVALLIGLSSLTVQQGVIAKSYGSLVEKFEPRTDVSTTSAGNSPELPPGPIVQKDTVSGNKELASMENSTREENFTREAATYEDGNPSVMSLGGDFSTQAALQIPRTFQSTDIVSSTGIYEVTFITSTAGAIDRIRIDFPATTNIGAAGVVEKVGIGAGTLLKSGNSITYDVTAPVIVPADTFIRLEISGIRNPSSPSTGFTAMITTRDSGGNLIDGPSQTNVYTIKQIGTNELADFSVTTSKLDTFSVTGSKIASDAIFVPVIQSLGAVINVPPGTLVEATAGCLPDEQLVSGGNLIGAANSFDIRYVDGTEFGFNNWRVRVANAGMGAMTVQADVQCIPQFIP